MMSKYLKYIRNYKNSIACYGIVIVAFIAVQAALSGGGVSSSLKGQLVPICAYVIMAISLNLTVGVLGELSLGHAGFMSIGAFTGITAGMYAGQFTNSGTLRLVIAIVAGVVLAGIFGALIGIPVLRLRGDYLAIVTLAFGEIVRNLINCIYVGMDAAGLHFNFIKGLAALELQKGGSYIIKGAQGVSAIPQLSSFTAGFILILITLFIVLNLINSKHGRAIQAVRDNLISAECVGINATKYKMCAFVTSAALAGGAGALYAFSQPTVTATQFDFNQSILILVFVVLGGTGNIWGSIIAASALTLLPEVLRQFRDYRMLVYAVVLILVMILTNSPQVRGFVSRVSAHIKEKLPKKGGTANE
jgi:branched-chain amino acid transport system permease protein